MVKILKIGGSIITDKVHEASAKLDEIDRIAREIAAISSGLILIHGAGSFGHVPAMRYGLTEKFNPAGLIATHASVVRLNQLVVEALSREGANPMPLHPFSCVLLKEGRVEKIMVDHIIEMLENGLVPVLHGDVAMDLAGGAGIVSGDQLVSCMARLLKAKAVAIGTNVNGVMFNGRVLPVVTRKDLTRISKSLGGGSGIDVTGGMKGKLLELIELAESGIDSIIYNAEREGLTERALRGMPVGTAVRSEG